VLHQFTADQNGEHELIILNAESFDANNLLMHIGWAMVNEGETAEPYNLSSCPPLSADADFLLYQQWIQRVQAKRGVVILTYFEFKNLVDSLSNNANVLFVAGGGWKKTNYIDSNDMAGAYWLLSPQIDVINLGAIVPGGFTAFRLQYNQASGNRAIQVMDNYTQGMSKLIWIMRKGNNDNGRLYVYCFASSGNRAVHNLSWTWTGNVLSSVINFSGTGAGVYWEQLMGDDGLLSDWWKVESYDHAPEGITSWNMQVNPVNDATAADGFHDFAGWTLTDVENQEVLERLAGSGSYSRGLAAMVLPMDGAADVITRRNSVAWAMSFDPVQGHDVWNKVEAHEPKMIHENGVFQGLQIDPQITQLFENSAMEGAQSGSASGGGALSGVPSSGSSSFLNSGTSITTVATADEYITGAISYEITANSARLYFAQSAPLLNTGECCTATFFVICDGVLSVSKMLRASSSADVNLTWFADGVEIGNGVAPAAGFRVIHLKMQATADAVQRDFRYGIGTSSPETGTIKIIHMMLTEGELLPTLPILTGLGEASLTVLKDEIGSDDIRTIYNTAQGWIYIHLKVPAGGLENGRFLWSIGDGSSANRMNAWYFAGRIYISVAFEGETAWELFYADDPASGSDQKILVQFQDSSQTLTINGAEVHSASSRWLGFTDVTIDTMTLGGRDGFSDGNQLNGGRVLCFEHGENIMSLIDRQSKTTI
jgi:hypothetical protein